MSHWSTCLLVNDGLALHVRRYMMWPYVVCIIRRYIKYTAKISAHISKPHIPMKGSKPGLWHTKPIKSLKHVCSTPKNHRVADHWRHLWDVDRLWDSLCCVWQERWELILGEGTSCFDAQISLNLSLYPPSTKIILFLNLPSGDAWIYGCLAVAFVGTDPFSLARRKML